MKNKGFTLVELLAVIVILALILAIAIPRITDLIENAKIQSYISNEEMMIRATMNYIALNEKKIPNEIGTISIITVEELQNSELISSINDVSDSSIECDGYVFVKNIEGNTFDYIPYLKCENNYQTEGYNEYLVIDVLVVGGGGAGSGSISGGGGAGGVLFRQNYIIAPGEEINVTVGGGGIGGETMQPGSDGDNSSFGSLMVLGGGRGGTGGSAGDYPAGSGGSGGGGQRYSSPNNPFGGTITT